MGQAGVHEVDEVEGSLQWLQNSHVLEVDPHTTFDTLPNTVGQFDQQEN